MRVSLNSRTLLVGSIAMAISLASCSAAIAYRLLRMSPIALSEGPVLADERWAAYQPTATSTVIIDSRSGRHTERANPSGCVKSDSSNGLVALGGNELLFLCAGPNCAISNCESGIWNVRAVVENASTGAVAEITQLPFRGRPGPVLIGIGDEWLELGEFEYKVTSRYFINWRTGEIRKPEEAKNTYVDLNGASPMKRYCAPLSRPMGNLGGPAPNEFGGFGGEIAFRFPFALENRYPKSGKIQVLRRCGTEREEHLPAVESLEAAVTAGIASWGRFVTRLRATGVHWHGPIYRLKTSRSRRFPDVEPGASIHIVNTATTIYVFRPLPVSLQPPEFRGPTREEIYAVRMP
ncbi:MAG TPA: hypothetical protein VFY36_00545 [Solirubrobacteraceae bacterium]|nr:hypothetical protein [Solirubrobacteraceae bacterium]